MNEKTKVIPKGAIFTITTGEYSDYQTETVCKAIREIDVRSLQDEYLSEHKEQSVQYRFNSSVFLSWLINKKEYAEEIDFFEFHIGNYSTADFRLW